MLAKRNIDILELFSPSVTRRRLPWQSITERPVRLCFAFETSYTVTAWQSAHHVDCRRSFLTTQRTLSPVRPSPGGSLGTKISDRGVRGVVVCLHFACLSIRASLLLSLSRTERIWCSSVVLTRENAKEKSTFSRQKKQDTSSRARATSQTQKTKQP